MHLIMSIVLGLASILLSWIAASMVVVIYYMWKLERKVGFPIETWLVTGVVGVVTAMLAVLLLKSIVLFMVLMVVMFVFVKHSVLVVLRTKLPELYDQLK